MRNGVRSLILTIGMSSPKVCNYGPPVTDEYDGALYHVTSRGQA